MHIFEYLKSHIPSCIEPQPFKPLIIVKYSMVGKEQIYLEEYKLVFDLTKYSSVS